MAQSNRKRYLLTGFIVGCIILIIIFMMDGIRSKVKTTSILRENRENIFWLQSDALNMDTTKKTLVIYFNPECHFCQQELTYVSQNRDSLNMTNIVLVSTANDSNAQSSLPSEIYQNLKDRIVYDKSETIYKKLGIKSIPHILIYSAKGKLVKEFIGETRIEGILKYCESR